MLSLLIVSLLVGLSRQQLDCSKLTSCESCAGQSQGFLRCEWCVSSNKCSVGSDCPRTDAIEVAFDCPKNETGQFPYTDDFGRQRVINLASAVYSDSPQLCFDSQGIGFTLTKFAQVKCDDAGEGNITDTCTAYVAVSDAEKAVAVVFRGTITSSQAGVEVIDSLHNLVDFPAGGKVHEYFHDAFFTLWNDSIGQELMKQKVAHPDYELWVIGHSLGGAMACLCGAHTVFQGIWETSKTRQVTLGEPRTGDVTFAAAHDRLVPNSYRIVHAHDYAPHIPPKMGADQLFQHRYEVWYNNDMHPGDTYTICDRPDDDSCSNSVLDIVSDDHWFYFACHLKDWGETNCAGPCT